MDKPISLPMHMAACDSGKDDVTDEYIVWISLSVYLVKWSCGHLVRQVGFFRVLRFPPTQRPSEANIGTNKHD